MSKPAKQNAKAAMANRIAELERKLMEAEAAQAHVYHFAKSYIKANATRQKMAGSGIIVRLNYLGGKEVSSPFMLKDGFSDELIAALVADMQYSYANLTEFKP